MKRSSPYSACLMAMVVLAATLPVMPSAFAQTCYSAPIVGVVSATGVWMQISSGYDGYSGMRLITAAHVVGGNSFVGVSTNCGRFNEAVAYKDTTKDFAIVGTVGIYFSGYYVQGASFTGESIKLNTWSLGSFSGTIGFTSNYPPGNTYDLQVCGITMQSGMSGSPIQDSSTGTVVGIALAAHPMSQCDSGGGAVPNLLGYDEG